MDDNHKLIKEIYTNLSHPSAYSSAQKIHQVLKNKGIKTPGLYKIRKWLQDQDDYSLQRPVRRNFKRVKVIVSSLNEQLDIDLLDMQSLSKYNNKVKYLLIAIDVFSRYAYVRTLKDKTGKHVEQNIADILTEVNPKKIRTDGGAEFSNRWIKQLFKRKHIYHHITLNEVHANYVERFNRTFKTMIFKYLNRQKTYKYIDVLQSLVVSYNSTPHRSLNNMAPNDVNKNNSADLWAYMYLKPRNTTTTTEKDHQNSITNKRRRLYKYKIGQLVRISYQRKVFTRAYNEQWSYEVFKITRRFQMQGLSLYRLSDLLNFKIDGSFYQSELQTVNKNDDAVWEIEKVLRKRKHNRRMQLFVKWLGYPNRFNSWIDESDMQK